MEGFISSYEAQNRFAELLGRVERGEELIITRHDTPVARIVPASRPSQEELRNLFGEIEQERTASPLNPKGSKKLRIRDLIEEGRE